MKRKASAVWQGGLKDGKGTISADSGVLSNVPIRSRKDSKMRKEQTPKN